ncbi:MAG TPA: SH3 domain-containing protein, partial [Ktedonobacterales bacterium]|nr:SH3 domain-containing protein [Ktedonobacterales bacterium]
MQRTIALALIALAASLALGASGTSRAAAAPTTRLFAQQPCTAVYAAPDTNSRVLTQLLGGGDVTSVGQLDSGGARWQHVRIWSGLEGYILAGQLGTGFPSDASEGTCEFPGVPDPQDDLLPASHGPWPTALTGKLSAPATLYARADGRALPLDALPVGAAVAITAWAGDGAGWPWYQVSALGRTGWLWSGNVRLDMPNPARH